MQLYAHNSIIQNRQVMEPTLVPNNRKLGKEIVKQTRNVYCSAIKKDMTAPYGTKCMCLDVCVVMLK